MAKRASRDTLTGGTRDVNPQFISGRVTLTAANTLSTFTLSTPIVRVGQSGGKATIMELLKVFLKYPAMDADAAAATGRRFDISFATTEQGATTLAEINNPRVIIAATHEIRNAFTAAGTGVLDIQEDPRVIDLTDGAGHGVLIATDNIFIQANTSGQTAASSFDFKLLYRFKDVTLVEYIGIVQSQQ